MKIKDFQNEIPKKPTISRENRVPVRGARGVVNSWYIYRSSYFTLIYIVSNGFYINIVRSILLILLIFLPNKTIGIISKSLSFFLQFFKNDGEGNPTTLILKICTILLEYSSNILVKIKNK